MSLMKNYLATAKPVSGREVVHCKLLNIVGFKPVMVNDVPKDQVSVTILTDDVVADFIMFKDSISGFPNFIPKEGLEASITLKESIVGDKTYVNAIGMGVKS